MSDSFFRPAPKPVRPRRKPFDHREWARNGAAKYAETRAEQIRERLAEDPGYRPLQPGGPLPPINRDRKAWLREAQFAISTGYREWVINQPCAACGSFDPEAGRQPAHVGRTRGAGAKAETALSLCWQCHDFEHNEPDGFDEAFFDRHGVWPWEMALYRYEVFHREVVESPHPSREV